MKTKMALKDAQNLAQELVDRLRFFCDRIEIAGSVRRQKPEVGDIEIIAIPHPEHDFFGELTGDHALNGVDWSAFGILVKGGNKYKQIALTEGINLDLFICTPPAQFGVLSIIRTGPAEYSQRFVTRKQQGGMLPSNMKVKDGAIWLGGEMIHTPEEADVYKLIGAEYVEPQNRKG